ncbi:MAG TPA: dihydropteroate synthase [Candidatus Dormibacteraeota bacterium]|nr:dihydropteroate synthase [Candidatus Dormibacteraeota bacterium]
MSVEGDRETVVRLLAPYPDLSTLGADSAVRLQLEVGGGLRCALSTLAEIGPDGIQLDQTDSILIEGRIGRLLEGIEQLDPERPGWASARALGDALGHLRRPAPPLRLGKGVWEFGKRTYLLGVVNVTPDSFSGDGLGSDPEAALTRARQLIDGGADALDIGGESTRPGHSLISAEEELSRVLPALRLIATELPVPIFVDTSKAEVARAALAAGAAGVNDVWGLRRDPDMARVVAEAGVPVICMHNQIGTEYQDLLGEILAELRESLSVADRSGIAPDQVVLDPGIGFGKLPAQNYEVLRRLVELRLLGRPILVGTSRKSLIGWLLDQRPVDGRLFGTAATVAWAINSGADLVRVHDVAEMRDVARITDELARRTSDP